MPSDSLRIPGWLHFLAVGFPSPNVIATSDGSRVIFDSGFGSDTSRIEDTLATAGGPILDPPATFAAAHARYERMRADPQRAGWHACKRIFAFALMIRDGIPLDDVDIYLTRQPWLVDHASKVFDTDAETLAADLLAEMRRTGAVEERGGRLRARTPHRPPAPGWLPGSPRRDWLHEFTPPGVRPAG
ncbi:MULTISPECIES: hypothetical protein [unclassified Frankia]|uniref:hypothetical protein n=1 Tax=unclassified Frankia TaxID=2632575 RepID=UPI0020254AAD